MTELHDVNIRFRELFSEFADDPEKALRRGTITEEEIENLSKY